MLSVVTSNVMECLFSLTHPCPAQLLRIVVAQHGVHQRGSQVAASLTSFYDNLGYFRKGFHHVFGLLHMHKAYRCGNNARRMCLALTYQVAEFHKCRRCIAEYKESIGMLLHSQADACLVRVMPFSAAIVAVCGSPR